MATEKILVTGATGKIGRELVPRLLEAGVEVKAGTRNPETGRALFPPEVEVVELNYNRTETYDDALMWAERVFLMPPPFSPDAYNTIAPFLDWAVSTRVEHVVLLSGMAVPEIEELALRRLERHLEAQDTRHTILRPNLYMQNFHSGFIAREIGEEGRIRLPAGDGRASLVDVRDVAAVAARALTSADLFGQEFTLTGPEALTITEAAQMISKVAGREITYEPIDDAEFEAVLADSGWNDSEVEIILRLFSSIREGGRAPVVADIETVLGRAPHSFEDFAAEDPSAWH
ncbi:MAG: NAD-dependent epimerase/dehydratase family protein [Gemmatimonadales bacterium]|nr:MAG: NAD-dependent epimerase/dehydratase family protein [Gemmatimonadales bacterium]